MPLIVLSTWFNFIVFDYLIDFILPDYFFISYYSFFDISKFFMGYVAVSTLLKLSKEWFEMIKERERISRIEKEKTELELKALHQQINPHFLFNSLNVLYSLALKKADESPDAIIKLSDILRHVIYESNKEFVDLSSEIKLINDYIDLQKFRIGKNASISFEKKIECDTCKIAPMIFLPLVENSFKHGIKGDVKDTFIRISLTADEKRINLEIKNNRGEVEEITQNKSGIGISNIRERLKLLYPQWHTFKITEDDKTFKIRLEIKHAH